MKTTLLLPAIAVTLLGLTMLPSLQAAERPGTSGPIQHILDEAKELNLTEDQKTKLIALGKELAGGRDAGAMREKIKEHPELAGLLKEMAAARKSGDEAKLKELREKLRASEGGLAAGDKAGAGHGEIFAKLREILTPEQLQKLKALREAAGESKGPGKNGRTANESNPNDKTNKPDASKGVPSPFE